MSLKILMVCLGNICRSPMAHGLLQHKAQQLNLDWEIDSAGTSDWHRGQLPESRAISCMLRNGIDINYQRSRVITHDDLKNYDIIYVMDKNNLSDVLVMAKTEEEKNKVALIMSLVYPEAPIDVPDPYFGIGDKGFDEVYTMLDEASDVIIEKYTQQV